MTPKTKIIAGGGVVAAAALAAVALVTSGGDEVSLDIVASRSVVNRGNITTMRVDVIRGSDRMVPTSVRWESSDSTVAFPPRPSAGVIQTFRAGDTDILVKVIHQGDTLCARRTLRVVLPGTAAQTPSQNTANYQCNTPDQLTEGLLLNKETVPIRDTAMLTLRLRDSAQVDSIRWFMASEPQPNWINSVRQMATGWWGRQMLDTIEYAPDSTRPTVRVRTTRLDSLLQYGGDSVTARWSTAANTMDLMVASWFYSEPGHSLDSRWSNPVKGWRAGTQALGVRVWRKDGTVSTYIDTIRVTP